MAITTARREKLPSAKFGLPGKGTGAGGKGPGSYPLDTPGRARSALSRASANASPAQQATIKSKVRKLYPSIAVAGKKGNGKAKDIGAAVKRGNMPGRDQALGKKLEGRLAARDR